MNIKNNLKSIFSKENIFYTIIFIIDIIIIVANRIINGFDSVLWLCDLSSIFGILNVIYAAKHKIHALIFNLLSTLILIVTNLYQHIWLNSITCILICTPSLIYGIIRWKKNEKNNSDNSNLSVLSKKLKILCWLGYAVLSVIFAFILKALNGNLYVLDAIYSAGSIFGVILSSYAVIDQFLFFNFANFFGFIMYIFLAQQNINNITYLFAILIFIIMNTVSYINWKKLLNKVKINDKSI